MWIKSMWDWILRQFGIKKSITTDKQQGKNAEYTRRYKDISDINFDALFAQRLSTKATSDSELVFKADNKRAELLSEVGLRAWKKISKFTSLAMGTGGSLIVPYVKNGKILFDIVTQDRLSIHSKDGEKITAATVLADSVVLNDVRYFRFTNYTVENNILHITNRTTTQYGRTAVVDQWKDIQDISIANVDRVPFGYIKSPADNKDSDDYYGVPITYGCEKEIKDVKECLQQIDDEFKLKKVRVWADKRIFKKNKEGNPDITSQLFFAIENPHNDKGLIEVFSPEIRESAYYNHLTHRFELLEQAAGTSRGILTKKEATYENKDAVREANAATWAIVTALRDSVEEAFADFFYACDVLANYYGLSPAGKYSYKFEWDQSLIESSTETWQQMKDLQSMGAMSRAELRAWHTGEKIEDAQKAIDEIKKTEPTMRDLLGTNNNA
ncbi:MAG: hypothetical protein IKT39_02485 [Clostridia bacterium]|nr:hypothetical protein [Clostridia bacterium]